ncbi:MAG TPA: PorT family protein [Flavobacteriia bacterium]|nr:PorT family protein [Flavobacteriia bacterium]
MSRIFFTFLLLSSVLRAQETDTIKSSRYLEDQIYIGFSIATLIKIPNEVVQNGFSNSFEIGFIKDFPFTERGNFALGIGLGYGRNTYFQNIKIEKIGAVTEFQTVVTDNFKNNKFSVHSVELPFEIRWRTSTISKYKFWRIYVGTKVSYVFTSNAKFKEIGSTIKIKKIPEINKLQFGLRLAAGYGTWNFNFYYGLTDLFSNASLNETTPLRARDFRIGLIFYIL